tara:strand:+ start:409 stop:699 length:291 start_codon:yes stop_codon:yes gene_type:complete
MGNRTSKPAPSASRAVKLEGKVSALSERQFSLGTVVLNYSNAGWSDIPEGRITEGLLVEVFGTLNGKVITANLVEKEEDIGPGPEGIAEAVEFKHK